jgi:tetratricopeptide (TPR) repeat protein
VIHAITHRLRSLQILGFKPLSIILGIPLIVLLTFGQTLKFAFVWDDINFNIVDNPYLNKKETAQLSTFWEKAYAKLYIPLTYTAWYLQAKLSRNLFPNYQPKEILNTTDLNPAIFHAFNILLHTINALLVALLTFHLFPQRSFLLPLLTTAIYAIHPLQIEVVAWITGFKDLLCTLFILLSLLCWLHYRRNDKILSYTLTALFFIAALLSKPSAIILPFLLIVIDTLHLKIPLKKTWQNTERFLYLAIGWIIFTKILQPDDGTNFTSPLWARPFIALDAIAFYLQKIISPFPLCIDYGRTPQYIIQQPWIGFTAFIPILILFFIFKIPSPATRRQFITLYALTLIALAPTLGIIPFEYQSRYSTVADRYAHLALIPISIAISMILIKLIQYQKTIFTTLIFITLATLAIFTHNYTKRWETNLSLYESDVKINPRSQHLQINYAVSYSSQHPDHVINILSNAIASIQIQHDFYEGLNSLGVIYGEIGQPNLALRYLHRAAYVRPDLYKPQRNIALILHNLARYEESLTYFEQYLKMQPHDFSVILKVAETYYTLKNWPQALKYYQQLTQQHPPNGQAFIGLAASAINTGQYTLAITASREALRLLPSSYDALINLSTAFIALNQHSEAIPYLERASAIQPKNPQPHILLAIIYHHLQSHEQKKQHIQTAQSLAKENNDLDALNSIQTLLSTPSTKTK